LNLAGGKRQIVVGAKMHGFVLRIGEPPYRLTVLPETLQQSNRLEELE
jgi:hypothetical protein